MHSLYRVFKDRTVSVVSKANSTSSETMTRVQECCKMRRSESVDQRTWLAITSHFVQRESTQ
jgi:hypothetical protein